MVTPSIDNNVSPVATDPGFRNSPRVSYGRQSSVGSEPQSLFNRFLSQGRSLFTDASSGMKTHVNASPWLAVGVSAISFMAIGYWLGGRFSGTSLKSRKFKVEDIDAAAAEDLTIGRSY